MSTISLAGASSAASHAQPTPHPHTHQHPQLHSQSLLRIRDLEVRYRTGRREVEAVRGVSLDVAPGSVTAVVGESGSGKSSIAQAAIGLLASNGRVAGGSVVLHERRLGDTELIGLSERRWQDLRGRCIGLIPQDPSASLNPVQTVGKSVSESLRIHGHASREEVRDRVHALLEQVGIDQPIKRAQQYPHEFSGGMRQRALIAAAIANKPELVIADEPTSALDVTVQRTVLDLLDELREQTGMGMLFITHDLAVAADRADSVVVMRGGEVQEHGPSQHVLAHPEAVYTRQLIADAPGFGELAVGERQAGSAASDAVRDQARPLLEVRELRQEYGRGADTFVALDGLSFSVARGTTHAIVGESGSGKTTAGRAIAGFAQPTSGSVRVLTGEVAEQHLESGTGSLGGLCGPGGSDDFCGPGAPGIEVMTLSGRAMRTYRRTTQMVYQNPFGSLDPRLTVGQTLAEPLRNFSIGSRSERASRVARALELVTLPAEFAHRLPRELSGGQRQRVAIARALIVEPELVVLDEAVSALDVTVQAQILRLLARLQRELGLTYVFISHDLAVVRQVSDTVSVLQRGKQVEHGTASDVFECPQHPYTRRLLEAIPGRSRASGNWVI